MSCHTLEVTELGDPGLDGPEIDTADMVLRAKQVEYRAG